MTEDKIEIRICEEKDLPPLEAAIPSPGVNSAHQWRFGRQTEGKSLYLIAWLGDKPVGHVDVVWEGLSWRDNEAVKQHTIGCPEMNGLEVVAEFRSRGIGTKLIIAAEEIIRRHGYKRAGLAVAVENPRAKSLYDRLGYRDWG